MLTVLFATLNRASVLGSVLESYCELEAPPGGWRLIVVDNGSTDATRGTVTRFTGRLPIDYLFEGRPGKNSALNTGLTLAQGDLLVFTDDDVFPRRDWLRKLRRAADAHPDYGIFGGQIVPRWETRPAQWILDWVSLQPVFALTNPVWPDGPINPGKVYGPNMAVRTTAFASMRFDSTIGPCGARYAMGSETELIKRLAASGYRSWHVREAVVEHFIRSTQLNRSWILARAIRYGRGEYRLSQPATSTGVAMLWGVPRYFFREFLKQACLALLRVLAGNKRGAFQARWDLNYMYGCIFEARSMARAVARARTGP